MSYHVKTNNFEGPFDILLYLVSRQRVDIGTIAVAEIADQYLEEIAKLENLDLDVASDFLLVASTLLELKAAKHVSFKKVENAIARIAEIIKEKTSINVGNVTFKAIDKTTISLNDGGKAYMLVSDATPVSAFPIGGIAIKDDLIYPLVDAINAGMPVDQLNEMIQNLGKVNGLGTTVTDYATRLNQYIEEFGNKIVYALNSHQLTRALAPCIFFESAEGIARMQEGLNLQHGMMTIYMSSPTEELLAPAFKKYLAVKKNGKTVFGKVFDGSAQLYTLDLTEIGDYEVILSCVDYYGYVVTKRYTVDVK